MKKLLWIVGAGLMLAGCHTDMWTQAKVTDFDEDETGLFADGTTARPKVEGTVARGWAAQDESRFTGFNGDTYTTVFPAKLVLDGEEVDTAAEPMKVLKRGQERFNINCSHCHGALGDGKGMINQRGFTLRREPASYHTDRLRNMPIGHFYDVISHGYGMMFSQAGRVLPDDRWAIVAYIRALQLSQNAGSLSAEESDLARKIHQDELANEAENENEGAGHE